MTLRDKGTARAHICCPPGCATEDPPIEVQGHGHIRRSGGHTHSGTDGRLPTLCYRPRTPFCCPHQEALIMIMSHMCTWLFRQGSESA